MKKVFFDQKLPVLAGVVRVATAYEATLAIKNFALHGATGIDLHLSCLNKEEKTPEKLKEIFNNSPLPILALHYRQKLNYVEEPMTEEERIEELVNAVKNGAQGIDMQGYSFDRVSKGGFRKEFAHLPHSFIKANPKEVVVDPIIIEKQCEVIKKVHEYGGQVLLSNHLETSMTGEQFLDFCKFLELRGPDAIKIVANCNTEEELIEVIKGMILVKKEVKTPTAIFCNGKYRALTRILNTLLGGCIVFVTDTYTPYCNLAQLDLTSIKAIMDNANALHLTVDNTPLFK